MRRHLAAAVLAVVACVGVLGTAAPASAAETLQDFNLMSGNGRNVAVARGLVVHGVGTFVRTGSTSETLTIPGAEPVELRQTVVTRTTRVDQRTCTIAVSETGTFEFDQFEPPTTIFGGSGPYTLNAVLSGRRLANGACDVSSPTVQSFALSARSSEIHAVS